MIELAPPATERKRLTLANCGLFKGFDERSPFDPDLIPKNIADIRATVVFVCPLIGDMRYHKYTERFIESYQKNDPGVDHDSVVVFNGAAGIEKFKSKFSFLPNLRFITHDNTGYDIGAFQRACREIHTNLVVLFGVSTYFNRPGWLVRMMQGSAKHGNALYGAMGNRGNIHTLPPRTTPEPQPQVYRVWPHIRTTAFWMHPKLFRAYPQTVTKNEQRHPFEHGPECFTGWTTKNGLKAWVVTWASEYEWRDWDSDPNGFHRGKQSNLLAGDHISEPPFYPRGFK